MPSPLARTEFRYFFAGRLISLLGSSMAPVALTFAILDAAQGSRDLGIVLAGRMIPLLAFLLVGGAVADRYSRRTVLVLANLGAALTQGSVAALLLTDHYNLAAVAVLEFGNGVLDAFTMPALRGVVPQLVEKDQLRQANSLLGSTRNASKILGPSVAGVLVVTAGSGAAIAFDAATFAVAAVLLSRLRLTDRVIVEHAGVRHDIRRGWVEFRSLRWLWIVSLSFCLVNLVQVGTWQILGPMLTRQHSGAATWGFVLSARGIGLLVMSAAMYRIVVRRLLRFGQLASVLGALPLMALGLRLDAGWLVAAAFLAGLGSSVTGIGWDTSLQEHVAPQVLSRVSSFDDLLSYCAIPVGQLAVGPLATALGGARVAGGAGVALVVIAWVPLLATSVRDLPHAVSSPSRSSADAR